MSYIDTNDAASNLDCYPWLAIEPDVVSAFDVKRPKAVDLFSGAGGFSLAALLANIDVVAAVEKNPNACTTYEWNLIHSGYSNAKLFQRDILSFEPPELMAEVGLEAGECHVLLGGPPCQGFSTHRIKGAGIDDPRNKLLLRYFEFVQALRPAFFLVENVPGMLWPRHESYVNEFCRLAEEAEYELPKAFALNAKEYGVPQNRKRVFLLGRDKRRNLIPSWPPQITHDAPNKCEDAGNIRPWRTAETVFVHSLPEDDPNNIHMHHTTALIERFRNTPANGGSRFESGFVLKCHDNGYRGHRDVYGRINPAVPGPTMTTACFNPSKGRFVHPTEHHGITLRHAARFQTFPDWFVFSGGLTAGGCQIGNAVPVDMARQLLEPIAAVWEES